MKKKVMKTNQKIQKRIVFIFRKRVQLTAFNTTVTDPTSGTITMTGTDAGLSR